MTKEILLRLANNAMVALCIIAVASLFLLLMVLTTITYPNLGAFMSICVIGASVYFTIFVYGKR